MVVIHQGSVTPSKRKRIKQQFIIQANISYNDHHPNFDIIP
jgi:hypothetical protein